MESAIDEDWITTQKKRIAHQTMIKAFTRYSIMRTRMKLSFQSFVKNESLTELWLKQMSKSFKFLRDSGQIKVDQGNDEFSKMIDQVLKLSVNDTLKRIV